MRLPFNYSLWVGDRRRGLHWYTDTDEGWTAPRDKAVELTVTQRRAVLRIHVLASGPAKPLRLRFGLLATPIRPLRPGWRTMRLGGNPKFWSNGNCHLYDTAKLALLGRCPLDRKPDGTYYVPKKDRDWLDGVIDLAHQHSAKFVLYTSAHGLAEQANAGVYQAYHAEWDMLPRGSYNTGWRRFFLVCPRSRHVDYFMWNLDRMLKAGKLDAVYFDQAAPGLCKNALHGCGYQDGALRRPTQTIRAQREFYRRARQVFLDNGLDPMVIGHTSTQVIPACYTHLDALLNGEQFTGCLVDNDHIKSIDEPMLLTQWNTRLMGIPPIFLPEIFWQRLKRERWNWRQLWLEQLRSPASARATRNLLALLLPNDIIYYGGLMDVDLGQRVWAIWDQLGEAKFVSHRDAGLSTTPSPPRIQTGLYIMPDGEAILAIGHLDEQPAAVTVRIDSGLLPLDGKSILDVLDQKPTRLKGQEVLVDVGGKDLRLLVLRKERGSS